MSNSIRPRDDIQIAAMNVKKAAIRDPMAPGTGTPWEDRGSLGFVGALFKTIGQSLFANAKLLSSIRRPETFNDAQVFAIVCGVFWGLGMGVQSFLWTRSAAATAYIIDPTMYWAGVGIEFVGAIFFALLAVKLYAGMFRKMVVTEMKGRNAPAILMQNLTAYSLGPSVFALIPFVGPALAGLWIFVNFVIAGLKRLQLGFASTFIGVLLSFIALAGIGLALHYGGWYVWNSVVQAYATIKKSESFLGN